MYIVDSAIINMYR